MLVKNHAYSLKHWTPDYFVEHFGNASCKVHNSQGDSRKFEDTTVAEFFKNFGRSNTAKTQVPKLKVSTHCVPTQAFPDV
jgi:hypothetical protein